VPMLTSSFQSPKSFLWHFRKRCPLLVLWTKRLKLPQISSLVVSLTDYQDVKQNYCEWSLKSSSAKDSSDVVRLLGLVLSFFLPRKMENYASPLSFPSWIRRGFGTSSQFLKLKIWW
jgi:hypothetical protein